MADGGSTTVCTASQPGNDGLRPEVSGAVTGNTQDSSNWASNFKTLNEANANQLTFGYYLSQLRRTAAPSRAYPCERRLRAVCPPRLLMLIRQGPTGVSPNMSSEMGQSLSLNKCSFSKVRSPFCCQATSLKKSVDLSQEAMLWSREDLNQWLTPLPTIQSLQQNIVKGFMAEDASVFRRVHSKMLVRLGTIRVLPSRELDAF
ncbi:hypothetical protein Efla_000342 [Eimeria flavescens]